MFLPSSCLLRACLSVCVFLYLFVCLLACCALLCFALLCVFCSVLFCSVLFCSLCTQVTTTVLSETFLTCAFFHFGFWHIYTLHGQDQVVSLLHITHFHSVRTPSQHPQSPLLWRMTSIKRTKHVIILLFTLVCRQTALWRFLLTLSLWIWYAVCDASKGEKKTVQVTRDL